MRQTFGYAVGRMPTSLVADRRHRFEKGFSVGGELLVREDSAGMVADASRRQLIEPAYALGHLLA